MAATNHTTHYGLSQYLAEDKPSYLTDYNADMLAIDNAIYAAQSTAEAAAGSVPNATQTAQNALETATDAKSIAEDAQGKAANAENSAAQANTTAGQALAAATQYVMHGWRETTSGDPSVKISGVFNALMLIITMQVYATAQAEGQLLYSKTFGANLYPQNVPDFEDTLEVPVMSSTGNNFVGVGTLRFAWDNATRTFTVNSVNGFSAGSCTDVITLSYGATDAN